MSEGESYCTVSSHVYTVNNMGAFVTMSSTTRSPVKEELRSPGICLNSVWKEMGRSGLMR